LAYLSRTDRREAILQAAIAVILRDGFAAMTTRAVAAELKAANGIIHHHFATAQLLRREAFARFYAVEAAAFDRASQGLKPADALRLMLADPLDDAEGRMRLWIGAWSEAQHDADFAAVHAGIIRDMQRRLAGLIEAAMAEHRPAKAVDAGAVAWRLLVLGHGLGGLAGPGAPVTPELGRRLFAEALALELGLDPQSRG
jgi:AcrR family transcriptional regulator